MFVGQIDIIEFNVMMLDPGRKIIEFKVTFSGPVFLELNWKKKPSFYPTGINWTQLVYN